MNKLFNLSEFPLSERCLGAVPLLTDAPGWIYDIDNPYLHGVYAPTLEELHAENLEIEGEIPSDLVGAYFRNGPNPLYKPRFNHHPFDGDGMVHAVYFRDGKVSYRNRYIQTMALQKEAAAGHAIWPGVMGPFDFSLPDFPIKDTGNTDICVFQNHLMPTWYNAGHPYKLDATTLETVGAFEIVGRQQQRMSAHNHVCPHTGEMLFMDYGDQPPYMTYGVIQPNGKLLKEVAIDLPGPRLPHDLGFTRNYTILHDFPLFHDVEILKQHNARVLTFHRDMPARFGVIPRYGDGSDIRWYEFEACYVLHLSNCWEEGDWIIMDGCRSTNPIPESDKSEGKLASMLSYMRLEANNYRWQINLKTGDTREGDIDDLNTEFNKSNRLYHGIKSRYAYHQKIPLRKDGGRTLRFTGLVKYDNQTGRRQEWDYGNGVYGSEAPFAPVSGADEQTQEDLGYVITITTDTRRWQSHCLIFDAQDIAQGPIAKVRLPHRVPNGFHAYWAQGSEVFGL